MQKSLFQQNKKLISSLLAYMCWIVILFVIIVATTVNHSTSTVFFAFSVCGLVLVTLVGSLACIYRYAEVHSSLVDSDVVKISQIVYSSEHYLCDGCDKDLFYANESIVLGPCKHKFHVQCWNDYKSKKFVFLQKKIKDKPFFTQSSEFKKEVVSHCPFCHKMITSETTIEKALDTSDILDKKISSLDIDVDEIEQDAIIDDIT